MKKRLVAIEPQIEFETTAKKEIPIPSWEIEQSSEYKKCNEDRKMGMARLRDCYKFFGKTKMVYVRLVLSCDTWRLDGNREPVTDLEKEYCNISKQLSKYRSVDFPYENEIEIAIGWSLKMSAFFGLAFVSVESLKYTIRAAIKKPIIDHQNFKKN